VEFVWRHGDWALRDCDDCQKYIFRDGEIVRGPDGEPLSNPVPPQCGKTPCKSREAKPRLSSWQADVLRAWRACRQYRCLPLPGGLAAQDEMTLAIFEGLDGLAARLEREELETITARK